MYNVYFTFFQTMLKHNSCESRWFLKYVEKKQERAILQRGHLSKPKIVLF